MAEGLGFKHAIYRYCTNVTAIKSTEVLQVVDEEKFFGSAYSGVFSSLAVKGATSDGRGLP